MIMLLAAYDTIGLFLFNDGIAHGAHLGGLLTGVTFFLLRSLGRPLESLPMPSIRRRVPVAARGDMTAGQQPMVAPRAIPVAPQPTNDEKNVMKEAVELDRVLDKISATGISSLSDDERQFLDAMARRRRDLN